MHSNFAGYEQQYQLHAADGTIVWQGTTIVGVPYLITNSGAAALAAGNIVAPDGPNSTFGRDQNLGTSDPDVVVLSALIAPANNVGGCLGVCITPIAIGGRGAVAGVGSLGTVRMTSAAAAVGASIITSATAGLGAAAGAKAAGVPAYGATVGLCIKANAQIGATGNYAAGILVLPSSN